MRGDGTAAEGRGRIDLRIRAAVLGGGMAAVTLGWLAAGGSWLLEGVFLRDLWPWMGAVAAVAVPVTAAVAWVHAGGVTRDMRRVAAAAREMMHDSSWGRPVPVARLDEVGEVTRRVEALRRHCAESLERAKRARREAEQADRDKTEFLTSVSHELRTPLNAIVGFADVLLAEIDGPLNDGQREDLTTIRAAGLHLVALFTDVLDLSAAASGHLRLERRSVALGPILEEVASELRGQRGDRSVEVSVRVPDDLPPLWGDATRLRQVVTNLAGNALKFTEEGQVRLEAKRDGPRLLLTISDTGPGMDPEVLPMLFAEFTQVGQGAGRVEGSGLGLAISRRLVELHGGSIDVRSAPGRGTTVEVRLPLGEAP